jgi:hypothetical protein
MVTFGQSCQNVKGVVLTWSLSTKLPEHERCGADLVTFGQSCQNVKGVVLTWSLSGKVART